MPRLSLSDAPAAETGPVKVWRDTVVLPTFKPAAAEPHAMYFERRVYQGSSGKVYPLPFISRIAEEETDVAWQAVHLENEYLRVMILPELGGRIHVARDKTNGYDLVYRQDVIKPALVGLAGPWISGGIEFNWPQHHRPGTFLPTSVQIEHEPDGSVTVWCSEHEPMNRMSGVHGVRLRPGRSLLELRVRLYNRTELTQTFLWWANVATEVNEMYEAFFPPDVHSIADHARRATSRFPHCQGRYYGVDYAARAAHGMPQAQRPRQFPPQNEHYRPDDLRWYANIPVPTSYMCQGSQADFFGGYDHAARAGIVHVAGHHIAPGKKLWTWGNHEFGYAWDRNLTQPDERGIYRPYIELMAGVFTDNQPDFSFLAPGETRTFSQYWYPIRDIGPAVAANEDIALSLRVADQAARIGIAATGRFDQARVRIIAADGKVLDERVLDLAPDRPGKLTCSARSMSADGAAILVLAADGRELLDYRPPVAGAPDSDPRPATEPPSPQQTPSLEELFLIGTHLDQYRHATRDAGAYWREALRRSPTDSRCNVMMGAWHLRRGEFEPAVERLRLAVEVLTARNPNPRDGEAFYLLGAALLHLGREQAAYDALYKSTWNAAWQSPGHYLLAVIDCRRRRWTAALEHLERALRVNVHHLQARDLQAVILRRLGRSEQAAAWLAETLRLDPTACLARYLSGLSPEFDIQTHLDLAWDLWNARLADEAIGLLESLAMGISRNTTPMAAYTLALFYQHHGRADRAAALRTAAQKAPWGGCFPSRLDEIAALQAAMDADPSDARAPFYLGNLLYDRRRHEEAIRLWEKSVRLDPGFAPAWRSLGIGWFNIRHDQSAALDAYERAVAHAPADGRILYERDQLWKRVGVPPQKRLEALEQKREIVDLRDDLSIELVALYNLTDRPAEARRVLVSRRFQPWEGGEGMALAQHTRTFLKLGQAALAQGKAKEAVDRFTEALAAPVNLGEAHHLLANQSPTHYWLALAYQAAGDDAAGRAHHALAADAKGDFQEMTVQTYSETTLYSALSMAELGHKQSARALLEILAEHSRSLSATPAEIDYFATSLPNLLLFTDDLDARQRERAKFLLAQANFGLGRIDPARQLLREILADNPNHADAADLLRQIAARLIAWPAPV